MTDLDARDRAILRIVADAGGNAGTRSIDIRVSQRCPPTSDTVLQTLLRLQSLGYVVRHTEPGSPHDRWELTEIGRDSLKGELR